MGIADRKQREKEERRTLILKRAKDLILERGVDSLSMQEIADSAELSKATLYLYFPGKEAILAAILEEAARTFIDYAQERTSPEASGIEAIHSLWKGFLDFYGESEDIFILTGINRSVNPGFPIGGFNDTGEAPMQSLLAFIAAYLEKGISDGTIMEGIDPVKSAKIIVMVATSIIDQAARLPRQARDAKKIQEILRETLEIILRGFAGPAAPPEALRLGSPIRN
jgi:AcrR family transcriptional regulator